MTPKDPALYKHAAKLAAQVYRKPSAYRSGYTVKLYKQLGGEFVPDHKIAPLKRWFAEQWRDIGHKQYPVYRPTLRITDKTPLTASEIDPRQRTKQIALKQKIRGLHNLPPFKPRAKSKPRVSPRPKSKK
jgi:hypothetical protein